MRKTCIVKQKQRLADGTIKEYPTERTYFVKNLAFSDEICNEISQMLAEGKSKKAICDKLGISRYRLNRHLEDNEVIAEIDTHTWKPERKIGVVTLRGWEGFLMPTFGQHFGYPIPTKNRNSSIVVTNMNQSYFEIRWEAIEILQDKPLNDWERKFLDNIKFRPDLSEKQRTAYNRICKKYRMLKYIEDMNAPLPEFIWK
ncbi:hypothetical protein QOT17_022445 [Balamuthia mandrillaris]